MEELTMELNNMSKVKNYGALFILFMGLGLNSQHLTAAQEPGGQVAQVAEDHKIMQLLRTCLTDPSDNKSFSDFVAEMIAMLENPNEKAGIQKAFPILDIPKLIKVLKNIQFKTTPLLIGLALMSFFKILPQDLQNMSKLNKGLTMRLAKSKK